ncbi:phosphotransferase [Ornithinibacillus sp. L9]|uniref:Phosphotransferase n=1 Tax=Ornithinibacillus caprae TaxID=2678566 RepID=A0A6N8FLM7_9BACI|nr:phosphotransferase [Ornithinibacillus caprae]MUK88887.1 phosphotransferase [Ornithinibacillus caprae]
MTGKEILGKFGFEVESNPESIYPFSPVYKITSEGKDYIVKRTQKQPHGLMNYVNMLREHEIRVVSPVELEVENPQTIGDETYVVYPFILGKPYTGSKEEIYEAGKLLGNIHARSPKENTYQLGEYDVYDFNEEEIDTSVKDIVNHATKVNISIDSNRLEKKLLEIVSHQVELKNSELPYIATPHDYKANNLVYTPSPYLIDPDNATWIPRIFDLALALLLFHNEMNGAPDRLFTKEEWDVFLSGYKESINLEEKEISYWTKAIEHVFLDEVMWLMAEYEEDWERPAQQKLFINLLETLYDSSEYPLRR